jgi:hypothetical protein
VVNRLRALEQAGLDQIMLDPPMDGFAEFIDDFAKDVIQRV